jgi:hypothetical protein
LGTNQFLTLNTTAAASTVTNYWYNGVTSSVFGLLGGGYNHNLASNNYVAYCFAAVAGYSAFGSYTGNGSADGPFVFTGFRPRWIMVKRTDSTGQWNLWDTARANYNCLGNPLFPNSSAVEDTTYLIDILSNGFKLRTGAGYADNDNGATYIYAAFAETPFAYARAR